MSRLRRGDTELHIAAVTGDLGAIQRIIASGVAVDVRNGDIHKMGCIEQQTPLHRAAYSGQIRAAELLLSLGADIEARDRCYKTPLHFAVIGFPNLAMVDFLLNNGADINAATDYGVTPLITMTDYAEERDGAMPIMRLLLERGATGVEVAIQRVQGSTHPAPTVLSVLRANLQNKQLTLQEAAE